MIIKLTDLDTNTVVISRVYDAGGGTDSRFLASGSFYYTPTWQIEQLSIDASLRGHDFELIVLGTDCAPTGHEGYVYLDGFGSVRPPVGGSVPEPATALLAGIGLFGIAAGARRRTKTKSS